ncbi:MAG: sodium:alanine symporter family protein [Pseudomonadota bacterium]
METITNIISTVNSIVWGKPMLILILGVGLYLLVGLRFMPWKKLGFASRELIKGRKSEGEGEITPFQALMTALSATVGTGNIIGVAAAILIGGPGAVFWMWMTALVGMATKYGEAVLAVKYREVDKLGNHVGGPMYYIKNGLGSSWNWLAILFAVFGTVAAFGIGNMFQSNAVAGALSNKFDINPMISGLVMAILAALVIIGGIKRLGAVAGKLVPIMIVLYIAGALLIVLAHISEVPAALALIIKSAFTIDSAAGGAAGSIIVVISAGVARGVFSNEAGLGSAPIAHAAAQNNSPVRQGVIGMLGVFIDTILVCTLTALVIVISGLWQIETDKTALSFLAFGQELQHAEFIVIFGIVIFAYTTVLGWSFYGERCAEFLFGERIITPYRVLWIISIFFGATRDFDFIILLADTMNALMAIPNLIALALLSPVVFQISKDFFDKEKT